MGKPELVRIGLQKHGKEEWKSIIDESPGRERGRHERLGTL